ncbi:hypothetical protein IQ241_03950 [Romeria aff. gracilis LEGE 07310]|uniref:Uncharacterized protein n=1 Tax=Vasconcelosia minhoensis LEGE 07310 TaxID=915328 RepID=A0A8J7AJC0_9CYAN|nr:hypothetical protein [Romeria gracilis]MBE9076455.1 hypothetical protein [Romeria aff. gracilis LEGE 07310]
MTQRDLFAQAALDQIPKILTLLDRNPHSPTYGCFDRNFWQYKIIDFPSGMSQEFVWPLALVYSLPLPNNLYYQQPTIRDWVLAGILYAARSAHADGSCDDYFPFERAGGAAAFSLLACVESYELLGLDSPAALDFFRTRANWLAHHHESGRLTNHQALIVLCLIRVSQLLGSEDWQDEIAQRLDRVFAWQNPEGWFQEYEGCDPGYHTLTLSCLARVYDLQPSERLRDAIAKGVTLAAYFVHPDGSYGGEYTSRNTYNFFPHGFELVGRWLPEALSVNDRFLEGLARGLGACYADDHIVGHHTWNYLLAWQAFVLERPPTKQPAPGRVWLQEARVLIEQRQDTKLYLALNKGGAFKFFRGDRLVLSDTQFSLLVRQGGALKNAVGHLVGPYQIEVGPDEIVLRGSLGWAKQKQMTTLNLIILRAVMYTVGRFFPNLIRKLLQKVLITGKKPAPFDFTRQFRWRDGTWQVTDELRAETWENLVSAGIAADQTSIYVVMSRTFQAGQLQPWLDLTAAVQQLSPGQPLRLERTL